MRTYGPTRRNKTTYKQSLTSAGEHTIVTKIVMPQVQGEAVQLCSPRHDVADGLPVVRKGLFVCIDAHVQHREGGGLEVAAAQS